YDSNTVPGQFDGQIYGQGSGHFDFDLSPQSRMEFYGMGKVGHLQFPEIGVGNFLLYDSYLMTGLKFDHDFNESHNLHFQTTYQHDRLHILNLSEIDHFRHNINTDLQYTFKIGTRDVLLSGANFRRESVKFNFLKPGFHDISLFSFFLNNDFKILDN